MAYYLPSQQKWRGQFGSGQNRKTVTFLTKARAERWEEEQRQAVAGISPVTWHADVKIPRKSPEEDKCEYEKRERYRD